MTGAIGFDECDGGEDAAESITARTPKFGHHRAGERIGLIARSFGSGANTFGRGGFDAGRAAKGFGNSGARKTERFCESAQSGGGHGSTRGLAKTPGTNGTDGATREKLHLDKRGLLREARVH